MPIILSFVVGGFEKTPQTILYNQSKKTKIEINFNFNSIIWIQKFTS